MMRLRLERLQARPLAFVLGGLIGLVGNFAFAEALPVADLPKDREVDYTRDIEPVLKKNCVACHNESTDEAGVNLESPASMQASDAEDVLVPGKPDASRLFLLASHAEEPVMPPDDNGVQAKRFSAIELALLKRWIERGAPYDQAAAKGEMVSIQPLPATVQTVYASSLTADGELSAVGFGNRIELFTRKSAAPLESLERVVDGQPRPAHDDFVQAMQFSPDGQTLVSSGYRNVRIWRRRAFSTTAIPNVDGSDVLSAAVNQAGSHIATLSPRGEVAVASVGKRRWDWMKGFDLPAVSVDKPDGKIALAVSPSGQIVAIAMGKSIWIVRSDSTAVESLTVPSPAISVAFTDDAVLFSGHVSGVIMRHQCDDKQWNASEFTTEASPVSHLVAAPHDVATVGVNDDGKLWRWNAEDASFKTIGKLPAAASGVAMSGSETPSLWVSTVGGVLGTFNLNDKSFQEVATSDPVAEQRYHRDQWQTVVAQRVQSATEAELKAAENSVKAETESLDKIAKDIAAKEKSLAEVQAALENAKQQADEKAKALADARAKQQSSNEQRGKLAESLKQVAANIEQMEKQLEELSKQKQDTEAKLAAIPEEKALEQAVKKANEAADKAADESKKKQSELDALNESVTLAKANKQRGAKRLDDLTKDVEIRKQNVEQSKAEVAASRDRENAAKALVDQAKATSGGPLFLAGGGRAVTRNAVTKGWSLWADDGTWLGELDIKGEIVAAGATTLLCRHSDQTLKAHALKPQLWQLDGQIGSVSGESPFGDRVLCVAIDPSGRYLATGGGLPSRTGELMLWNLADGTLVRRFDKPHDDTVQSIRFSPDGKTLASGGADRMVHLWDVESGKRQATLEGHTHHVTAVAWGLAGREVASGAADGVVKIWDLKTGKAARTINGIKSEVTRLVYVGSDGRVGITSGDGYLSIYRTDNGRRETYSKIPAGYLYALDRNRDGSELIIGGADGLAVRVDKSGKTLRSYDLQR